MFITVAGATLPSVPLDFQGNLLRILESIRLAKAQGATLRTGPEVGYHPGLLGYEADSISWRFLDMDVSITTVS
jgi:predicted amidohydrolase